MKAQFTLQLPVNSKGYFIEIDNLMQIFYKSGWAPSNFSYSSASNYEKNEYFRQRMIKLWREIGELTISNEKYNYEIDQDFLKATEYYGMVSDTQTEFFVTMENIGQVNFYLFSSNLYYLQKAVSRIINYLLVNHKFSLSTKKIYIFSAGSNSPIIVGNLVKNILTETLRANKKDQFLLILSMVIYFFLYTFGKNITALINLQERIINDILAASLATIGLSIFGLLKTYLEFYSEKKSDIVSWKVIGED